MWWLLVACASPPLAEAQPAASPPPILLLSIDTLRADRLGAYGNTEGLSPNLDKLAGESVVFEQAYAQANETCFSHASLLTGRYPSELGRLDFTFRMPSDVPSMAGVLKTYGYETAAAVGGGYLSKVFGFSTGFDHYDDQVQWGSLYHTAPKALKWLDERTSAAPFFLFLHTYDLHARYLKPSPFGYLHGDPSYAGVAANLVRSNDGTIMITDDVYTPQRMPMELISRTEVRFSAEQVHDVVKRYELKTDPVTAADVEHVRDAYDGAVAYADAHVGMLMASLEQRGLLDRAWLVVLADHGEGLGEHGVFNHRFDLGDTELHVPLIVRPPGGVKGGRRVSALVELTDVLPTVLEIAGATLPAGIRGRSLLDAVHGKASPERSFAMSEGAFRMVSARGRDTRVTFRGLGPDNPWLADMIAGSPLPGDGFVVEGDAAAAEDVRKALAAWRRGLPQPKSTATDAGLSAELVEALRAKGYFEAAP
ncbi:MAG: sulfatase [Myxococcota bacterium]